MSTAILSIALAHAQHGRAVLPAHSVHDGGRCTCGRPRCSSIAKHPRTLNGVYDATTDPEVIAAWWRWWSDANLALATGEASCVDVLDVDPKHDGLMTLARLEAEHGAIPRTWRARTGSGGLHIYLWHQPGMGNSTSRIGRGLDVRGDGGLVVLPPSRNKDGPYRWIDPPEEGPLASWPQWLARLALPSRPREQSSAAAAHVSSGPLPVPPGLLRYAEAGAPEGERNSCGFWLACRLVQECGATGEARAALAAFARACRPALEGEEVEHIWASAQRRQPYNPRTGAYETVDLATGERTAVRGGLLSRRHVGATIHTERGSS